jgi:ADP-heptose:LPS heptosyltransferase
VFSGTRKEYEKFCAEWKLNIAYLEVKNFKELTQAIARCKFYISNQTLGAHLANGIGKKRLIEICPQMANVWPTTKHGYPFMHNGGLEYYFKKFINE